MALRLNQNNQANFSSMDQFFADNNLKNVLVDTVSQNEIRLLADVQTRELQASSVVQMDDQVFQMYALLRRDSFGEAMVISRSSAPFDDLNLVR
jgi:type II secretory pathway component PulK